MIIYTTIQSLYKLTFFLRFHTNSLCHTVSDLTAIDYPEHNRRFEIVYNFLSIAYNARLRIKVLADEITPVPSLTCIYRGTS